MADFTDKDLKRLTDALVRGMAPAIASAMRQNTQSASPGRSSPDKVKANNNKAIADNTDSLEDNTDQLDEFTKKMKESGKAVSSVMNIQTKMVSKSLKNFELGAAGSSEQLHNLVTQSTALSRAMFESTGAFEHLSNDALDKFSGKLNKTVRNMVHGNDLLESMIKENSNGDGKQGMRDFQDNLSKLGRTTVAMQQAMEMGNVKKLAELSTSEAHNKVLRALVPELKKMGTISEKLEKDLNSTDAAVRKAALSQLDNAAATAKDTMAKAASIAATKANLTSLRKTLGDSVLSFTGMNHEVSGITAAFTTTAGATAMLVTGLKGLYNQFTQLGSVGLGGAIIDLNILGAKALLSASALGELVTTNKQLMGQTGLEGFRNMLMSNAQELRKNGLSSEEAAKANAAFAQSVGAAGISLRDPKFSQALSDQKDAFLRLRAVTGVTAEQFAALTQDLMNSHDMQVSMSRMDVAERATKLKGINAEMQRLTVMGLSLEQSKKIISANEALLGQTVKNRLEQSAKFQQAASIAGMGAEGAEAAQIMRKGRRATNEEKARLTDITSQVRGGLDDLAGQGGLGTENMVDALDEGLGGATKDLADAARELRMAIQGDKGISSSQVNKNMADGQSATGGAVRAVMDGLTMLLGNPLVQIGAGVVGLLASAWLTNKALNSVKVPISTLTEYAPLQTKELSLNTKVTSGVEQAVLRGNQLLKSINAAVGGKNIRGGGKTTATSIAESYNPDLPGSGSSSSGQAKRGGKLGKAAAMGGKVLGTLGKLAMKATGILAAGMVFIDGFNGWNDAAQTFVTDTPTLGQKISGALGGALEGLTFGLLSGSDIATGIYDTSNWIIETVQGAFNLLRDGFDYIVVKVLGDIGKAVGTVKSMFGMDESNFISDAAKTYEGEAKAKKTLRDTELQTSKDERQRAKEVRESAKKGTSDNVETAKAIDGLHKTSLDSLSGLSLVNEVAASQATNLKASQQTINNSNGSAASANNSTSSDSSTTVTKTTTSSNIASDPNAILTAILEKMTELVAVNTEMKDTDVESLRQMRKLSNSSTSAPSKSWVLQNA